MLTQWWTSSSLTELLPDQLNINCSYISGCSVTAASEQGSSWVTLLCCCFSIKVKFSSAGRNSFPLSNYITTVWIRIRQHWHTLANGWMHAVWNIQGEEVVCLVHMHTLADSQGRNECVEGNTSNNQQCDVFLFLPLPFTWGFCTNRDTFLASTVVTQASPTWASQTK